MIDGKVLHDGHVSKKKGGVSQRPPQLSNEELNFSHGQPMQEVTPKAVAIADSAATITLITIFQISFFVSSMAY